MWPNLKPSLKPIQSFTTLLLALLLMGVSSNSVVLAISASTPWTTDVSFQSLVYGVSTPRDVQLVLGKIPDDVVKEEQMYPVREYNYFYDEKRTGAASVFVFENNMLMGLLYQSTDQQLVDVTWMLQSNGDRTLNNTIWGGTQGYYPNVPMYGWYGD